MKTWTRALSGLLGTLALEASVARADEPAVEAPAAALEDARLGDVSDGHGEVVAGWGSVALFGGAPGGLVTTAFAPSFGLRLALAESLDLDLGWGLVASTSAVRGTYEGPDGAVPLMGDVERVEAGNPTLALSASHAWPWISLSGGLGFALPVAAQAQAATSAATAAERVASIATHEVWAAMHGDLDVWRFLPERASFYVPLRLAFGGDVGVALEAAGGVAVPVLGASCPGLTVCPVEGVAQGAAEVWGQALPWLRLGARASVAAWQIGRVVELRDEARSQASLEPWLRATFGPMFLVARATVPVGGPRGVDGADGVWAVHLGGGGALEPSSPAR